MKKPRADTYYFTLKVEDGKVIDPTGQLVLLKENVRRGNERFGTKNFVFSKPRVRKGNPHQPRYAIGGDLPYCSGRMIHADELDVYVNPRN